MKAWVLHKNNTPENSFLLEDKEIPKPDTGQVLIKSEAFGLNFADVLARKGMYRDCPPLPAIIGYETVGQIAELGAGVNNFKVGDRVAALTRFGGYAEYALTDHRAAVLIPEDMDRGKALALTTQYGTAIYAAEEMVNLHKGDRVLIQSAAGGVGLALVQLAKRKGCIIYGTAGSDEKVNFIKEQGVDFPINYRKEDFYASIKKSLDKERLDVVFDAIGGKSLKKGFKLLGGGGRMVCYGGAGRTNKKTIFGVIRFMWDSGIHSPIFLMMKSKSILGVYMLQVGDYRPHILQSCFQKAVEYYKSGQIDPYVGGIFSHTDLAAAHHLLESRQSMGKVVVEWRKE